MSVQKLQKALRAKQRREVLSESRMREICLSGSMSGEKETERCRMAQATAPHFDSTDGVDKVDH